MLLYPDAVGPSGLDIAQFARRVRCDLPVVFYARNFTTGGSLRNQAFFDIMDAVVKPAQDAAATLPWVLAVNYSSQQKEPTGEFLLELRTTEGLAEIHLPATRGQVRLTAGPFFDSPTKIVSALLYADALNENDQLTIHNLTLTRQYAPEQLISGYKYSHAAYGYKSRTEFEDQAQTLMRGCYEYMQALRKTEDIAGNSSQDAILPFTMEYSHGRFPYIIGNLNGLYWYGLTEHQHLKQLTTDSGMLAGDMILDCGAHTGHVACAMAAVGGPNTKIICFDPFPQNNYLTDLNRRLNHFNIEVAGAGVGRETKTVLASNAHQLTVEQDQAVCKEYPLVALDDYYATKPTFLKIDIEGFELEALLGAQKILHDLRPRVFIELHPQFFGMTGASYRGIYEVFPKDKYRLLLDHPGHNGDAFEAHLDAQPLGNLRAEPII
jgi:FkbM family methyltransferase